MFVSVFRKWILNGRLKFARHIACAFIIKLFCLSTCPCVHVCVRACVHACEQEPRRSEAGSKQEPSRNEAWAKQESSGRPAGTKQEPSRGMAKAIWAHCDRSSERLVKSPGYQRALSIRWRHANFNECAVQKMADGHVRRSRKGSTSHPCLLAGYRKTGHPPLQNDHQGQRQGHCYTMVPRRDMWTWLT